MKKFSKNKNLDPKEDSFRRITWAEYTLPNGVIIYVGNRPGPGCESEEFLNKIDGFINVTDRLVQYPKNKSYQWFPWNEGGSPTYEAIFGVLKTLNYWVNSGEYKHIYIHCDGGTHRAVSMFGFYLRGYHPEEKEKINNS